MNIFETLKELRENQHKKESIVSSKRKDPSYIYLNEKDNQIKEIPLSELKLDSSASVYINRTVYKNPAKLIHDSLSH
jgi:hypothetical protein